MIVSIMGLTGSGKSTVAARIAALEDMHLFDMDFEFPEEYRCRCRSGEVVSASDVTVYQHDMMHRMLKIASKRSVVMAGFFLSTELPALLNGQASVLWINLVTNNRLILEERVLQRKGHFAKGLAVLEDNWPNRHEQIVGDVCIDCEQPIGTIVGICLQLIHTFSATQASRGVTI